MNKKNVKKAGIILLLLLFVLFVLFAPCSSDGGMTYQLRGYRGCSSDN